MIQTIPLKSSSKRQEAFSYTSLAVPFLEYPHYEPVNEKAAEFHTRPEKIRLLIAGNQAGKTCTTTYDAITYARTHQDAILWMCSESYALIGEVLWPTYERFLHPDEYEWKYDAIARSKYVLFRQTNSRLYPKSYEQGRRKFQSAHVNYIQFDEEPPKDIVMECIARTSATAGRIVFGMTPLMGQTYVYKELFKKAAIKDHIWAKTMSYLENKFVSDEEKQLHLDLYGATEARRRVYGDWILPEGIIFNEYQPTVNVIESFKIPWNWDRIRAVDFGHGHPFVCLWLAQNPETGVVYVYREYVKTQTLLEDHAEAMHTMSEGDNIVLTVGEHASQERAELENKGIFIELANKDVAWGIQVVNRFFKQHDDGTCMCYIFDTCETLQEEIPIYQYDKYGKPKKEPPQHDTCDTIRYGLMAFEESVKPLEVPRGTQERTFGDDHYY